MSGLTKLSLEITLAVAFALASGLVLIAPDWLERIFAIPLDGGSGAFERALAGALGVVSVGCSWKARVEWRSRRSSDEAARTR